MGLSLERIGTRSVKKTERDAAPKTGICYDAEMMNHRGSKNHPERPERIDSIYRKFQGAKILSQCTEILSREATDEEILAVHPPSHLTQIDESSQKSVDREGVPVMIGMDTYINAHTAKVARIAAGSLLQLTDSLLNDEIHNGFAVIRPPGHHAEQNKIMGFCMLNNVAIAARWAQKHHNVKRVLIVDWDVHHGNGTQNIFEEDPSVLYFSVHRYEKGAFYPGTGGATEVGIGKGEGFNVNVPWDELDLGDSEYIHCFEEILLPIASEFDPELVLVSAGFDCAKVRFIVNPYCKGDPLGGMAVSGPGKFFSKLIQGFAHLTSLLMKLANGKILLALEGGYNLSAISSAALWCVKTLMGEPLPALSPHKMNEGALQTIDTVKKIQKKYWKVFQVEPEEELVTSIAALSLKNTPATPNEEKLKYIERVSKDFGIAKEEAEKLWDEFQPKK